MKVDDLSRTEVLDTFVLEGLLKPHILFEELADVLPTGGSERERRQHYPTSYVGLIERGWGLPDGKRRTCGLCPSRLRAKLRMKNTHSPTRSAIDPGRT